MMNWSNCLWDCSGLAAVPIWMFSPRHGHGPPEQIVGGRLFIEGMDLSARDVYTGRVLWKRELPHLDNYGVYYDDTYKDTPLDTAYNQIHIPEPTPVAQIMW